MINYIKPECMPHYYVNSRIEFNTSERKGIAHTASGYLLPCCWCDAPSTFKDFVALGMYNDALKVSNNETVEDIITSEPWQKFISVIMHDPMNAPRCCKEKCGEKNE